MTNYSLQTIKKMMVFRNITQRKMAEELGLNAVAMNNRMYARSKFKSSELERMAVVLGTTVSKLGKED